MVFVSRRDGNGEIYAMNVDEAGQSNLTNGVGADFGPAWSPEGDLIAFTSYRCGFWVIRLMNDDGSGVYRITVNEDVNDSPSWKAGSFQIAFQSDRNSNLEVY